MVNALQDLEEKAGKLEASARSLRAGRPVTICFLSSAQNFH
jgi:hypothetical protein